jgi:NADH-quinone oxidoreductase subunit D
MADIDVKEALKHTEDFETEELELNMGPQHPSTHGVLRLKLKIDGEIVRDVEPVIGYMHRCAEKIGECVTFPQFVPYTDRKDYCASLNENFGYCLAVEKLLGCEIPERADYLRVIMAELNRIASHLLVTGIFGLDTGAFTPMLHTFRERERILDLFEEICGARLTYNYMRIGGVSQDAPEGWLQRVKEFTDYLEPKIAEYNQLLSENTIFINRTANIGIMTPEVAISYGCSGPMLRGSGVKWDLRKNDPYSIYDRFDFDICVGSGEKGTVGDCWDRYIVRVREMLESIKIIRQAVDQIKEGPIKAKLPRVLKVPQGEAYTRSETPRGEVGFYIVSTGGEKAYRMRLRSPCYCNLSVISEISKGCMIADLICILGSVDIILGDVDR